MKRFLSALLALCLLLSLCGCAKKPEDMHIEYNGEKVRKLELDPDTEDEIILKAVLEPEGAEGKVEWSSSDRDVVKVKDRGDGSCSLTLRDAGEAKISAKCGELSAKVRVTVIGEPFEDDVDYSPDEDFSGEDFDFFNAIDPEPWEDMTVEVLGSKAGLPFTPNDVINSGLLGYAADHVGTFSAHIMPAKESDNCSGGIEFPDASCTEYYINDRLFTQLSTRYAPTGLETVCVFSYTDDGFIDSLDIALSTGEHYTVTGNKGTGDFYESISFTGDAEATVDRSNARTQGIRTDEGGFSILLGSFGFAVRLGVYGYDDCMISVSFSGSEEREGLGYVSRIIMYDPVRPVNYSYYITGTDASCISDSYSTVMFEGKLNGVKYKMTCFDRYYNFYSEDRVTGMTMNYYFNLDGSYREGTYYPKGGDKRNIDADGVGM